MRPVHVRMTYARFISMVLLTLCPPIQRDGEYVDEVQGVSTVVAGLSRTRVLIHAPRQRQTHLHLGPWGEEPGCARAKPGKVSCLSLTTRVRKPRTAVQPYRRVSSSSPFPKKEQIQVTAK